LRWVDGRIFREKVFVETCCAGFVVESVFFGGEIQRVLEVGAFAFMRSRIWRGKIEIFICDFIGDVVFIFFFVLFIGI